MANSPLLSWFQSDRDNPMANLPSQQDESRVHRNGCHFKVDGCETPRIEILEPRMMLSATFFQTVNLQGDSGQITGLTAAVGDTLYFTADDGIHGYELWKSDGTEPGTKLVKDIWEGLNTWSSWPQNLTNVNGELFFVAYDPTHGDDLWKSDGTEAGTVCLDILPGSSSSFPEDLTDVNGVLYFTRSYDFGLWKYDAVEGIQEVAIIWGETSQLTNVDGVLYFTAYDQTHSYQALWRYDDVGGVAQVTDILSDPNNLTNVNGVLYFTASDQTSGYGLWKYDGTQGAPEKITITGMPSYSPILASVDTTLYLYAYNETSFLYELWKYDTTQGTAEEIASLSTYPAYTANVDGVLYFVQIIGDYEGELWRSDGTAEGTYRFSNDLSMGGHDGETRDPQFTAWGNSVVFRATQSSWSQPPYGLQLWMLQPPSNISLSNISVAEGDQPAGTVVGTLSGTDPDPAENAWLKFELVDSGNYLDNAYFSINSATGELVTASAHTFDFDAKGSYDIKVRVTNRTGLSYDEIITIYVTNPVVDAIHEALGYAPSQAVTHNDLLKLTSLTLDSSIIHDLTDLAYATNLQSLYLVPSDLSISGDLNTVAPLNGLTQLQTLVLQGAGLTNTELDNTLNTSGLTALQTLDLSYNLLATAPSNTILNGLRALKGLRLYGNTTIMSDLTDGDGQYPSLVPLRGKLINLDLASDNPDAATSLEDLSNRLYDLPTRMYEWVLNNIDYTPYAGSMKDTVATWQTRTGNDWDTAALLKELLSDAGITDTQYSYGQIGLPTQQAIDYFGTLDLSAADDVAAYAGLNSTQFLDGLTVDHVWLQTTIDGATYNIDPSWKFHDFQTGYADLITPLLTSGSVFDQNTYLFAVRNETGAEYFEDQLRSYLAANYPDISVNDIPHTGPIHQQVITELPTDTPYSTSGQVTVTSDGNIPANKFHSVRIRLLNSSGVEQFTWLGQLSDIGLSRLTIIPVPSGGNFIPRLYVDGTAVTSNSASFASTADIQIEITHYGPGDVQIGQSNVYVRKANKYIAIGLNAHQTSEQYIAELRDEVNQQELNVVNASGAVGNKEAFYGGLMQLGVMSYFQDTFAGKKRIAELTGAQVAYNHIESGITTTDDALQPVNFDLPYPFLPRSMGIDVPNLFGVMVAISGSESVAQHNARSEWIGLHGSSMEAAVWEEINNAEGVSTVKLLQMANSPGGVGTITITAAQAGQINTLLPNVDSAIRTSIASDLASGKYSKVTVTQDEISVGNDRTPTELIWKGVGYIGYEGPDANGLWNGLGYIIHGGVGGNIESPHGGATGAFSLPSLSPATNNAYQPIAGDPVNIATGGVIHNETDVYLPNLGTPLAFSRYYNSANTVSPTNPVGGTANPLDLGMGKGWSYTYGDRLLPSDDPNDPAGTMVWYTDTGERLKFTTQSQNVTGTASLRVDPFLGHVPVASPDVFAVNYTLPPPGGWNSTVTFSGQANVLDNDYSVDGHSSLTAKLVSGSEGLELNSDGTFNYAVSLTNGYTPLSPQANGLVGQFSYVAVDGDFQSAPVTVSLIASSTSPRPLPYSQVVSTPPTDSSHVGTAAVDANYSTYYASSATSNGYVAVRFGDDSVTATIDAITFGRFAPGNGTQYSGSVGGNFEYTNAATFTPGVNDPLYTVAFNDTIILLPPIAFIQIPETIGKWFGFSNPTQTTNISDMVFIGTTTGLDRIPTIVFDVTGTKVGSPVSINPIANDVDVDSTLSVGAFQTSGWNISTQPPTTPQTNPDLIYATKGTVQKNGNTLTYTPPANWVPPTGYDFYYDRFQYSLTGYSGTWINVYVAVYNNNPPAADIHPPVANNDGFMTNSSNHISSVSVAANDYDPNLTPHALTYTLVQGMGPEHDDGTFSLSSDGTFSYQAQSDWNGADQFTYQVSNGVHASQATVVIVSPTAASAASPAVASDDIIRVLANQSSGWTNVLSNDIDRDGGSTLTLRNFDLKSAYGGTIYKSGTQLRYTPPANFTGTDVFQYTVANPDDSGGGFTNPQGLYGTLSQVGNEYKWVDVDGNTVTFDAATGHLKSKVDRYGNGVQANYSTGNKIATVVDINDQSNPARTLTFTYNTQNRISTVSDGTGRTWTYAYTSTGATGQLASVTPTTAIGDPDTNAGVTTYSYHTDTARTGLLNIVTDAEGRVTTYEYYANRRGMRVTDAIGNSHSFAYNAYRHRTSFIDEAGRATEYDYNNDGNLLTQRQPDGSVVKYDWNHGLRTAAYDEFGQKTTYAYNDPNADGDLSDSNGKLTGVTDPTGRKFTYEYQLYTVTGTGATFRGLDRTIDEGDPGSGLDDRVITDYDYTNGLLTSVTDAGGGTTQYTYGGTMGARGLPDSMTLPEGVASAAADDYITTYTYNAAGQITQQTSRISPAPGDSVTTLSNHDNRGLLTSMTDGRGLTTIYAYDLLGRRLTQTLSDPDNAGPLVAPINKFAYDKTGLLTSSELWASGDTSALRTASYEYDKMQRLLHTTGPDGSIISTGYDVLGNPIVTADALGRQTRYVLNARNQIVQALLPDGTSLRADYNGGGRLAAQYDALGNATTYEYDKLGRVTQQISADPDGAAPLPSLLTKYQYDVFGNLQYITSTNSAENASLGDPTRTIEYQYDALNRKTSELGPDPDTVGVGLPRMQTQWAYDGNGNITDVATGPEGTLLGDSNFTIHYTYDELNRKISQTTPDPDGGNPLPRLITLYGYDNDGNLTQVTAAPVDANVSLGNSNYTTDYTYDNLNRKTSVTAPDPDAIGAGDARPVTAYIYNQLGQLQSVQDPNTNFTTYIYDKLGRQVAVTTSDPDGAGPLDPMTTRTIYDPVGNVIESINSLGHVTRSFYDSRNRLVEQQQPAVADGQNVALPTTSYTYDDAGNLLISTDQRGATTRYAYDHLNRQTQVTDAEGAYAGDPYHTATTTYDALGRIASVTDTEGRTTSYQYDNLGRKTAETLPPIDTGGTLRTTTYAYDANGNLARQTDPLSHSTLYAYDNLHRQIQTTDAQNHSTRTEYDSMGRIVAVYDQLIRKTAYEYDFLDRKVKLKQDNPDYNPNDPNSPVTFDTTYTYDAAGNLLTQTDPLGHTTTYAYDALNRSVTTTDAMSGVTTTIYDQAGNIASVTDAVGNTTTYTYDHLNRQIAETDALGNITRFTYDIGGLLTTQTDPDGRVITYGYDILGRKVSETWYDNAAAYQNGVGTSSRIITWHYTTTGEVYAVDDTDTAGGKTASTYSAYNAAGLLSSQTILSADQTQPNWTTQYSNNFSTASIYTFLYIDMTAGLLVNVILTGVGDFDGELIVRSPSGRFVATTVERQADGSKQLTFLTDETGSAQNGQWTFYVRKHGGSSNAFNITFKTRIPNAIQKTTYAYDDAARLTQVTQSYPQFTSENTATVYTYDELDRVTTLTQTVNGSATSVRYAYDTDGRVHTVERFNGAVGSNLVAVSTYTYDAKIGRLTGLVHTDAVGNVLARYDYQYDAAGNMSVFNVNNGEDVSTQNYDATNQLTAADHTSAGLTDEAYAYDANGNRISSNGQTVTTSMSNRLADDGKFLYSYDDSGNLTARDHKWYGYGYAPGEDYRIHYTWDNAHRLTSVKMWAYWGILKYTAQYFYDDQGRRIKTVADNDGVGPNGDVTTYYLYQGSGGQVVLEFTDADLNDATPPEVKHELLWSLGGALLLDKAVSGGTNFRGWTLSDHEGTIRDVVSDAGVKLEHRTYDSFGNVKTVVDGSGITVDPRNMLTQYAYTGQRYEARTFLYDYHARWYDPRNGRFISEDPSGFSGGDDMNLYRYVGNNPYTNTDPTGLRGNTAFAPLNIGSSASAYSPLRDMMSSGPSGLFNPQGAAAGGYGSFGSSFSSYSSMGSGSAGLVSSLDVNRISNAPYSDSEKLHLGALRDNLKLAVRSSSTAQALGESGMQEVMHGIQYGLPDPVTGRLWLRQSERTGVNQWTAVIQNNGDYDLVAQRERALWSGQHTSVIGKRTEFVGQEMRTQITLESSGTALWGLAGGSAVTSWDTSGNSIGVSVADRTDYFGSATIVMFGAAQGVKGVAREGVEHVVQGTVQGATGLPIVPMPSVRTAVETVGHHPLPKFLGGDAKQVLSRVDPALHGEFHGALRVNLRDAGIPLNVGGRGGSTIDWTNYMRLNPGAQRQSFDAVLDASRYMDVKYGTSITQDVWRNIMNGSFTPQP